MARVIKQHHLVDKEVYSVKLADVKVQVTVTTRASVVERWLSTAVRYRGRKVDPNCLVVGLGVELTDASSKRRADTLQLCIGRRCLIFQVSLAESVPKSLRTFLKERSHTFVGFDNASDRKDLRGSKHILKMRKQPLDMTDYAAEAAGASMHKIVEAWRSTVNQKKDISTTSEWKKPYLSYRQIEYVTVDAYCAYRIGRNARVWNE